MGKWNARVDVRELQERCGAAGVSGIATAVAVTLWTQDGPGRRIFPKHETIAAQCRFSVRSVRNGLDELLAAGVIGARMRPDYRGFSLEYYLNGAHPESNPELAARAKSRLAKGAKSELAARAESHDGRVGSPCQSDLAPDAPRVGTTRNESWQPVPEKGLKEGLKEEARIEGPAKAVRAEPLPAGVSGKVASFSFVPEIRPVGTRKAAKAVAVKPANVKAPLPFQLADLEREFGAGIGANRVAFVKVDPKIASQVTRCIRALGADGVTVTDIRRAGEFLAANPYTGGWAGIIGWSKFFDVTRVRELIAMVGAEPRAGARLLDDDREAIVSKTLSRIEVAQ